MENKKIRKTEGFTLTEMLLVVAVIAIIVGIAGPQLTKNLERSRETTDAANIRTACSLLYQAWLVDSAEHEEYVEIKQREKSWTYVNAAGNIDPLPELTDAELVARKVRVIIDKDGKFAIKEK